MLRATTRIPDGRDAFRDVVVREIRGLRLYTYPVIAMWWRSCPPSATEWFGLLRTQRELRHQRTGHDIAR